MIAIRLQPQDETAFGRFLAARATLSQSYRSKYGVGAGERYMPHITLGYFMNADGAERARPHAASWNETMGAIVDGAVLTFSTASLYGFTDMATFFRKA